LSQLKKLGALRSTGRKERKSLRLCSTKKIERKRMGRKGRGWMLKLNSSSLHLNLKRINIINLKGINFINLKGKKKILSLFI
jgi:hypothetical protein